MEVEWIIPPKLYLSRAKLILNYFGVVTTTTTTTAVTITNSISITITITTVIAGSSAIIQIIAVIVAITQSVHGLKNPSLYENVGVI